ncbi:MAG TPA: hypothetical protein VLD16_14780 [Gaiellaceae bacterium]|nr:hypothetical protein [Gaiellaceae bacterium]
MADPPDGIALPRHRDLQGRQWHPWARRALLAVVVLIAALALVDVFGQRPSTTRAGAAPATLSISAPDAVRGGLLYQARFTIDARQVLADATLVLNQAWLDGMTVNTIEPSPVNEASRDGSLALNLGHLPAGSTHVLFIEFQVNPTTVDSRTLRATLEDGQQPLLTITRSLRIFP